MKSVLSARFFTPAYRRDTDLRSDAAPVVGVRSLGVQHGRDDRLVLRDQQVEGVGVGEDIVRVGELERSGERERERHVPEGPDLIEGDVTLTVTRM